MVVDGIEWLAVVTCLAADLDIGIGVAISSLSVTATSTTTTSFNNAFYNFFINWLFGEYLFLARVYCFIHF